MALGMLGLLLIGGASATMGRHYPALLPVEAAVAVATPTLAPSLPTATPGAAAPGSNVVANASAIYYDDGREVFVAQADGSGRSALGVLPPGADFVPHAGGGRLLYFDGSYWLATPQSERFPVTPPPLGAGETIFSGWPSPDGTRIAWQLYTPVAYGSRTTNLGISRIVMTDQFGGGGRTVLRQQGGSAHGDVPELLGWRAEGQPAAGGPPGTLLLSTRIAAERDGTSLRGVLEFDPSIGDLVNDYFPPLGSADLPTAEALSVSSNGRLLVFAAAQSTLPSGEGPLPTALSVLDLATGRVTQIDQAARYPAGTDARHPWLRYPFFSERAAAPIAPDDAHLLYTAVTVTYPDGALVPHLDETAQIASLITGRKSTLVQGARALGWIDATTALVRKPDGIYAVDISTKQARRIVDGHNLRFLGVRG